MKRYDKNTLVESENGEIVYFKDVKEYLDKIYKAFDIYSIRYSYDYSSSNLSKDKILRILKLLEGIVE